MAGRLVYVGGHRLHLECTGPGVPTVVLEPGAAWSAAHSDVTVLSTDSAHRVSATRAALVAEEQSATSAAILDVIASVRSRH